MKLTKLAVDKLALPLTDIPGRTAQKRYYDDSLKGFGIRVTSGGTKAFFIEKLIHCKLRRITIGRYPELTVEQARKEAHKLLGKIATGIDPIAEKKVAKITAITLEQVYEDYKKARKALKPKTLQGYDQLINIGFKDWKNKPFLSITKDKVAKHHAYLGENHGKAYANLSMRLLRALFNFAIGQYEDSQGRSLIVENPVKRLSQARSWFRIKRRQTFIKTHELFAWYEAVKKLENETIRDYLLLLLFTGLRREEAAQLNWEQVDLNARTLTVIDTKNHQPHTLPLSNYLYELLLKRKEQAASPYVFPGSGKSGHLVEPRKQKAKVIDATGISFTIHDFRRTFSTIAESLDISAYAVKRLLNHKIKESDVTEGYIIVQVERLRKPMQQITDYLLEHMTTKKTQQPIAINLEEEQQEAAVAQNSVAVFA